MIANPAPDGYAGQFPPIGDYGFLSDCETTALVAPDGSVEWLCLPRMDSASVFGGILDRDAGLFRVAPAGVEPSARRYVPGTLVLETSWWTPGGWLVVTDALVMGPWHHTDDQGGALRPRRPLTPTTRDLRPGTADLRPSTADLPPHTSDLRPRSEHDGWPESARA